ncbi:hypothetical protein Pan216_20250 [Planctomycetes bacterium Pan216]|uniref:(Na+)-NQR maturation NqrM n=1 Tax=Kolteria novifilia TaxID=2527975 RepID=A0A518B2F3_9BACT|nr:hypothetical protein Pan216_20250 [Planctomycetes bacterium Pan216]
MLEIALAICVFGLFALLMGIGFLWKGRCLKGSCGGEPVRIANMTLSCGACPKRKETGGSDADSSPIVSQIESESDTPSSSA